MSREGNQQNLGHWEGCGGSLYPNKIVLALLYAKLRLRYAHGEEGLFREGHEVLRTHPILLYHTLSPPSS